MLDGWTLSNVHYAELWMLFQLAVWTSYCVELHDMCVYCSCIGWAPRGKNDLMSFDFCWDCKCNCFNSWFKSWQAWRLSAKLTFDRPPWSFVLMMKHWETWGARLQQTFQVDPLLSEVCACSEWSKQWKITWYVCCHQQFILRNAHQNLRQ